MMKTRKNIVLFFLSAGMIVSCYSACTSFLLAGLGRNPIPVTEIAAMLLLATLTTYIHDRRGWRWVSIIGVHLVLFSLGFLHLAHAWYEIDASFWRFDWVGQFIRLERTPAKGFLLVLLFLFSGILWSWGIRLFKKPTDADTISRRFDAGLGFLLLLLLIKLMIAVKGAALPIFHSATRPILSFMGFGLFSMGIVRSVRPSQPGGVMYFKGAGVVMTFALTVLMLAGGLLAFLLPEMQKAAETGAALLGYLTGPIEQIIVFLFENIYRPKLGWQMTTATGSMPSPLEAGPEGIALVLYYFMFGLIVALMLGTAVFLFQRLIRWLFSSPSGGKNKADTWKRLLCRIRAAVRFLYSLWTAVVTGADPRYLAAHLYKRLLRWGRFSGLGRMASETPLEYGLRLSYRFPDIEKEIQRIIDVHDEAVYGGIPPDAEKVSRARRAVRKIRHPCFWAARLKTLCFHRRL